MGQQTMELADMCFDLETKDGLLEDVRHVLMATTMTTEPKATRRDEGNKETKEEGSDRRVDKKKGTKNSRRAEDNMGTKINRRVEDKMETKNDRRVESNKGTKINRRVDNKMNDRRVETKVEMKNDRRVDTTTTKKNQDDQRVEGYKIKQTKCKMEGQQSQRSHEDDKNEETRNEYEEKQQELNKCDSHRQIRYRFGNLHDGHNEDEVDEIDKIEGDLKLDKIGTKKIRRRSRKRKGNEIRKGDEHIHTTESSKGSTQGDDTNDLRNIMEWIMVMYLGILAIGMLAWNYNPPLVQWMHELLNWILKPILQWIHSTSMADFRTTYFYYQPAMIYWVIPWLLF